MKTDAIKAPLQSAKARRHRCHHRRRRRRGRQYDPPSLRQFTSHQRLATGRN